MIKLSGKIAELSAVVSLDVLIPTLLPFIGE